MTRAPLLYMTRADQSWYGGLRESEMYIILKDDILFDEFETYEAAKDALPFHMADHPMSAFTILYQPLD